MRTSRLVVCCALLVSLAASCGGSSSPRAPSTPGGGRISGLLVAQRSDGTHRSVQGGQSVGVYTQEFPPGGPMMRDLPKPVATTKTAKDGSFQFGRLKPGRYWIALVGQGHATAGKWVTVTPSRGASVLLVSCTDCPIPL